MKKLFGISVLALAVLAAAQQEALAWKNCRFGIGANLAWQSGNNSLGWGLWRDGQVPGAPSDAAQPHHRQGYGSGGPGYGGPGYGGPGYGGLGGPGFGGPGPGGGFAGEEFFSPEPPVAPPSNPRNDKNADGNEPVSYLYNVRPAVYTTPDYYQPTYYYAPQAYPVYGYGYGQ